MLGESYPEIVGEGDKTQNFNLNYIDWENPRNNVLHVTREFFVESQDKMHNARPDIVLFINGIPSTKKLTESQKQDLKQKWSSIRRLTSTNARIKRITLDISNHFEQGYKATGFKAMLAVNYKRDAVRYLECFEQWGELNCVVLISAPDVRESVDDADECRDEKVVRFWHKMMEQYGDADVYEETIKDKLNSEKNLKDSFLTNFLN